MENHYYPMEESSYTIPIVNASNEKEVVENTAKGFVVKSSISQKFQPESPYMKNPKYYRYLPASYLNAISSAGKKQNVHNHRILRKEKC